MNQETMQRYREDFERNRLAQDDHRETGLIRGSTWKMCKEVLSEVTSEQESRSGGLVGGGEFVGLYHGGSGRRPRALLKDRGNTGVIHTLSGEEVVTQATTDNLPEASEQAGHLQVLEQLDRDGLFLPSFYHPNPYSNKNQRYLAISPLVFNIERLTGEPFLNPTGNAGFNARLDHRSNRYTGGPDVTNTNPRDVNHPENYWVRLHPGQATVYRGRDALLNPDYPGAIDDRRNFIGEKGAVIRSIRMMYI